MVSCMKTTIEIPDDLLIEAKKRAAETRTTIRALVEHGLRRELRERARRGESRRPAIRWVTAKGGLPPGLDLTDRAKTMDWLGHDRD